MLAFLLIFMYFATFLGLLVGHAAAREPLRRSLFESALWLPLAIKGVIDLYRWITEEYESLKQFYGAMTPEDRKRAIYALRHGRLPEDVDKNG